jgi:ribosome-binding protein aMBF1 (putative translation factor)
VQHGSGATQNAISERRTSADVGAEPMDTADANAIVSAVCSRLRSARLQQGMSLAEAALRLRLSPSVLSRLEQAKRAPSLLRLVTASGALGVRLSDVLRLAEDEAFPLGSAPWAAGRATVSPEDTPAGRRYHPPVSSD